MASNSRLLERVVPRSGRSRRLNTLNTYLHRTSSSGVPGLCKCRQCPLPSICTVIYVSCTAFRACQNPHSCRFIPVFPPNPSVAQAWATDSFLALPYVPGRKSHQANCFLLSHLHLRLVTGAGSSWRHTPESHLIFVFHSPSPQANTSILYPSVTVHRLPRPSRSCAGYRIRRLGRYYLQPLRRIPQSRKQPERRLQALTRLSPAA